jgi:hypothetical protein
MPKYLLLKHYRGGPEPHRPVPPMDQWAPEDVEALAVLLEQLADVLEEGHVCSGRGRKADPRRWHRRRVGYRFCSPTITVATGAPIRARSASGFGAVTIIVAAS